MRRALPWAFTIAFSMAAPVGAVRSDRWHVDATESLLYVQVFRDDTRLLARASHHHVVRAARFTGELSFDPDRPGACEIALRIPARDLAVDEPWLRERLGYEGTLSGNDRREVRRSMLRGGQLDAARHPTIAIAARNCRPRRGGEHRVDVTVTLRGRSHTVPAFVRVEVDGDRLRASGRFTVRHTDFGIEPYTAWLGAIANADPMRFVAQLEATRSEPRAAGGPGAPSASVARTGSATVERSGRSRYESAGCVVTGCPGSTR